MRIYMFRSEPKRELQAFAEDRSGATLPAKFAPWHVTGVITEEKKPPFQFSRTDIEEAIRTQGFQLWRMKATAASPAA